jgi:CBS domain containing-hemolysin-like protein
MSWLCARGVSKHQPRHVFRAGLRVGQAAGFFGVFATTDLGFPLSLILPSAAYLGSTLILSDLVVGRAVSSHAPSLSGGGTPGDEPPAGLSVVVSRAERLKDIPVSRFMIPKKSIVACDSSAKVEEVAEIMRETGLSRVIAYSRVLDRPLGLAHIKDVLPLVYESKGGGEIESLLRPLVLVPSSARALDLLRDFQRLKRRVAIVRDLQGERTLGLVSTEDILEEMVGEIQDEGEALSAALESGVALVRGDLSVNDLTDGLGMPPYREEGDITVGELVKSLLKDAPRKGDTVPFRGLRMTVEETVNGDVWMVRLDRSGE